MPDAPYDRLLDSGDVPESDDRLLASVTRRSRALRARRLLAGGLALVILLGGAGAAGAVYLQGSSRAPLTALAPQSPERLHLYPESTGSQVAASPSVGATGSGEAFSADCPPSTCQSPLFTRRSVLKESVGGFELSGYLVRSAVLRRIEPNSAAKLSPALSACAERPELVVTVELRGRLVDQLAMPAVERERSPAIAAASESIFERGHSHYLLALVELSPAVAGLKARFDSGASSSVVPQHGYGAVLARRRGHLARDGVELVAKSASGSVLGTSRISRPGLLGLASIGSCKASSR